MGGLLSVALSGEMVDFSQWIGYLATRRPDACVCQTVAPVPHG
jgi:hypothetical protein